MSLRVEKSELAVGIFDSREKAEAAITELEAAGFAAEDIGIAARDPHGEWSEFHSANVDTAPRQGAIAGAAAGIGVGGLWALGIAAGVLPAIGPVVAGGFLGSLLASAATGAATGSLVGALVGMGLSQEHAEHYESKVEAGGILLTVSTGDRFFEALRILQANGGYSIQQESAVGSE
jgi:hypothetical protein